MVQCGADPCVLKLEDAGKVKVILVVHVDDILVGGPVTEVLEVGKILNSKFPANNLGGVSW